MIRIPQLLLTGLVVSLVSGFVWAQHGSSGFNKGKSDSAINSSGSGAEKRRSENFANPKDGSQYLNDSVAERENSLSSNNVMASTLLFWNIAAGKTPDPKIIEAAGLTQEEVQKFSRSLKYSEKLTSTEQRDLRSNFRPALFQNRLTARKKMLNLVERFQEKFPLYQNTLPEILTVWGEARGIKGFSVEDDQLQKAKMATIIHVLRNRSERQAALEKRRSKNPKPLHIVKWRVATKRYQFSAFEPYDPNLAELSMGPARQQALPNIPAHNRDFEHFLQVMPEADQRALRNLAEVIVLLNRKEIMIRPPLGSADTRHYLTPTLREYSTHLEKTLNRTLSRRLSILKLPSAQNTTHLAVVPRWAEQSALIAEPPVDVLSPVEKNFHTVSIPMRDFVYFKGLR